MSSDTQIAPASAQCAHEVGFDVDFDRDDVAIAECKSCKFTRVATRDELIDAAEEYDRRIFGAQV